MEPILEFCLQVATRRVLRDSAAAADLAQEAAIGIATAIRDGSFDRSKAPLHAYAAAVVQHACAKHFRRARGMQTSSLEDAERALADPRAADIDAQESEALTRAVWMTATLAIAIRAQRAEAAESGERVRDWQAFQLHSLCGLDSGEVARRLSLSSQSHVRTICSRMRQRILARAGEMLKLLSIQCEGDREFLRAVFAAGLSIDGPAANLLLSLVENDASDDDERVGAELAERVSSVVRSVYDYLGNGHYVRASKACRSSMEERN